MSSMSLPIDAQMLYNRSNAVWQPQCTGSGILCIASQYVLTYLVRVHFKLTLRWILTGALGLIQNADDILIETVKDLVEHYIAEKNTLIVIAIPMTG